MIRLIITASALSLAAAKGTAKSTKLIVSPTPPPAPTAKSVKSTKVHASVSMSTAMSLTTKSAKLTTKSAKLSKSSKSGNNLIASFACPGDCISAYDYYSGSGILDNAVATCDPFDEDQKWNLYFVGDSLKIESAAHNDRGMCLAIIDGDCDGGKLGLAHCGDDESSWYLEGGNLVSFYCWEEEGKSTAMSVDAPCEQLIAVDTSGSGSFTTSERFMFLEAED